MVHSSCEVSLICRTKHSQTEIQKGDYFTFCCRAGLNRNPNPNPNPGFNRNRNYSRKRYPHPYPNVGENPNPRFGLNPNAQKGPLNNRELSDMWMTKPRFHQRKK